MKRTSYPRFLARAAMTLLAVFCFIGARAQFSEDFEGGSMPAGWTTDGSGTWLVGTGDYSTSTGAGEGTYNAFIKHGTTGNATKLITPEIDLSSATSPELSFMYVMRSWTGDTDELRVYYRASSSEEWTKLAEYTDAVSAWTTVEGIVLPNPSNTYQLAFEMTDNYGYGVGIDNIVIRTVSCAKPSTFEVTDITTTGATFEWEDTEPESYSFEYKKASDTEWTTVSVEGVGRGDATIKTYTLSDLAPGTSYNVRVKAICGTDSESSYKTLNFTTLFGIPLVEEFGTSIPTGWSMYTGLLDNVMEDPTALQAATYGWSFGTSNNVFDNHARVNIYSNYQRWLVLPTLAMKDNVQLTFDLALTVYSSSSSASPTPGNQADDRFIVLITTDGGTTWTILREWNNTGSQYVYDEITNAATGQTVAIDLSSYAGQNIAIAFYAESTESGGDNNLHIDNVSIDYIPACPKPTNLAVSYEGGTTATVTWEGTADAYNIDVNGTVTNGVTSPYTLENLDLATTYEVKVQAVCSDTETSDWTNAVSFKTDNCMPEDMCSLTFEMADSYGDGWNGASIDIYDYTGEEFGELLATVTLSSGAEGTQTLNFCNGQELAIFWTQGSYDTECSYTITDINGETVAQNDFELAMAYTIDCTVTDCRRPTDFAASEIGPHSAVLSWTENGEATAWVIEYISENDEESTTITVESNPYTLTGLAAETMYAAQVSPVCDDDAVKPSEVIYWTTDVAAPAPTDLSATPLVTTAEVSWNGFAESYELEYTEGIYGSGGWLQYDDDSYATGVGNSSPNTWTWGVMYPGSMVTGTQLTKVSIYEAAGYNTEDITINIYSGGDTAPGELLYTQTVTPEAADAFHEITLDSPVEITQGQNLWITLTEQGTYVLSACVSDEPNNNWVNNGGTWAHLGDLSSSLAGEGWMIRGEMASGNDPSTATWIAVENPSSPCTLEGLNPETIYTFRVRGNFGDEGMSDWAMSTFTTNAGTEDPIDLAAETTSTTATLDWTGYQESYNVKYREALADPTAPATIILEAHDVWEDGTGYQMLLDGDATAFGNEIPESGPYTSSDYSAFEYLIPENADCDSNTENLVFDGSVTIEIPAGVYDWCIINPEPGGNMWISGTGDIPGRYDDYVFEPGVTYHFTMGIYGTGDGAALEIIRPMGDWITVENVTNPYELEGLTPDTYYEWQVQGILDEGTTNWVSGDFTTAVLIELANDDSNNEKKNSEIIADYDGETVDVTLADRTLFKDGSWNTICLPFDVELEGSPLEDATAKTLANASITGSHVSLTFGEAVTTLEAGVPYIIKWEGDGTDNIENPEFKNVTIVDVAEDDRVVSPIDGVKFIGYYDAFGIDADDENIYYMTADNTLKHTGKARTLKACRAYFEFSEAATAGGVREFTLNFGDSEATGIVSIDNEQLNNESGWYTVDGKKLDKQPKRKGVYINNGIKVVIK